MWLETPQHLKGAAADPRGVLRGRDASSQRLEAPGMAKANAMIAIGYTSSPPSDEVQIYINGLFCCESPALDLMRAKPT